MKKLLYRGLCVMLAVLMLCNFCFAEEVATMEAAPVRDSIAVGSLTPLSGMFFTDCWGNNTADLDVRALLYGCETVSIMMDGTFDVNPTVCRATYLDDAQGNRTYTVTINDGLCFSDGSPITARDYVFSILLVSGPEMAEMGGGTLTYNFLEGQAAYMTGEAKTFTGVRLLDDSTFTITINAAFLPNFYELLMTKVTPYPMEVLAPGCDVYDDGDGAYIAAAEGADAVYGTALLTKTILDEANGYLTHPTVVSGPYKLVSFENGVASFEKNDYYPGNFEGQTAQIRYMTYQQVLPENMMNQLASGEIDLINKVSSGDSILEGMQLVNQDLARSTSYLRTGFAFIAFACEQQATNSDAVRKAVLSCIDRDQMTSDYMQGYGMAVYGYYGYGQWMATSMTEELLLLNLYRFDLDAARALLESDGWTLDQDGAAYEQGIRYKDVDGVLTPLVLRWAKTRDSKAADYLRTMLEENLPQVGIGLEVTEMSYQEMINYYYRNQDRSEYNMFFLATNFSFVFDPYASVSTGADFQGVYNTTGIQDAELAEIASQVNRTESGDVDGYLAKWMTFQEAWVDVMPMAPLYSNAYADFYTTELYNYEINSFWSWSSAILYATFEAPAEETPADGEETINDDEIVILE